jgi:CHAT domain-containing protein
MQAIESNGNGKSQEAYRYSTLAGSLYEGLGNTPGLARSRFEEIYSLHRQTRSDQCIRSASPAFVDLLRARHYGWLEIQSLIESSICHSMLGDFEKAHKLVAEALAISRKYGYGVLGSRALGMQSAFDTAEGRFRDSWQSNTLGISQFWSGLLPGDRAFQFWSDLELLSEAQNLPHLAIEIGKEALSFLSAGEHPEAQGIAHSHVGQLLLSVGNLNLAEQEFTTSRKIFQQLPPGRTTNIYLSDALISLAEVQIRIGSLTSAAQNLDQAKMAVRRSETFTIQMKYLRARIELDGRAGNTFEEKKLLSEALALGHAGIVSLKSERDRWLWSQQVKYLYRRAIELESATPHDPAVALEHWRSYKRISESPDAPRIPLSPGSKRAHDVSSTAGLVNISFMVAPGAIHVWTQSSDRVLEQVIPTEPGLVRAEVQRFLSLCSDPSTSLKKVRSSGLRLYQWLLAPALRDANSVASLTIEADDFLAMLPWSALTGPDGQFLGEKLTIVNSAGYTKHLKTVGNGGQALLVYPGATTWRGRLYPSLPGAETELANLSSLLADAHVIVGERANAAQILKELPSAAIFHFAGHALSRRDGGELLTQPGVAGQTITASQLRRVRFQRSPLVVLSACSTSEEPQPGQNPDGLVSAFLQAGASQVISTRWEIDSSTTQTLMSDFYSTFHATNSVPEAIAHARRLVAKNAATSHPFYWSSFDIFVR